MIDFTLRELECFFAVAEELNFSRAASRLGLSQPPLSRHIHNLERHLGSRLFERTNRRVTLTAFGRTYYTGVSGAVLELRQATEAAKRAATGESGRLELAFPSSMLGPELVQLLQSFRKAYPRIQLAMHDLLPSEQIKGIQEGWLDGGFFATTPRRRIPGVALETWRREPLWLFLPPLHPLAEASAKTASLRSIAAEPMVTLAGDSFPGFASQVIELCRRAGFQPRTVQKSARAQAVVAMVAAGLGLAILPASMSVVVGRSVATKEISDRSSQIVYSFARREGKVSRDLAEFLATLRSIRSHAP